MNGGKRKGREREKMENQIQGRGKQYLMAINQKQKFSVSSAMTIGFSKLILAASVSRKL
jgi:hypothetical protein